MNKIIHVSNYGVEDLNGIGVMTKNISEINSYENIVLSYPKNYRKIEKVLPIHKFLVVCFMFECLIYIIGSRLRNNVIIHAHATNYAGIVAYLSSFIGCKTIFTFHNSFKISNRFNNFWIHHLDYLTCVSKSVYEDLLKHTPTLREVKIINNFTNKQSKKTKKKKQLIFIGHLNKYKGVFDIIEAHSQLNKKYKLHLVGDLIDGVNYKKLIHLSSHNIIIHNSLPNNEVFKLLEDSEILINNSMEEGYPLSVIEALNHNCKVVLSRVKGNDEIKGSNVYFFKRGDIKDMVRVINKAISKPLKKSNLMKDKQHIIYSYNYMYETLFKSKRSLKCILGLHSWSYKMMYEFNGERICKKCNLKEYGYTMDENSLTKYVKVSY